MALGPASDHLNLPDPLPKRRLLDHVGVGGRIKVRPEDFLVDELPLYEPTGEGEHLYLRVQKIGVSHGEMIGALSRHFHVPEQAIGFAGMKDKVGVTQQTVSIHLPGRESDDGRGGAFEHPKIDVVWATRHGNKLRRGHLRGNRFSIRIRDVDPMVAPRVLRGMRELERIGVPDYYGFQRFGYRCNTHRLGLLLLLGEWQRVVDELLGGHGSTFPEHQAERRSHFDHGRLAEAMEQWTRNDRAERAVLGALLSGRSPEQAVQAVGRHGLTFWVSALQSFLFNRVVDQRLDEGLFDQLLEGDLAFKHDSRRVFPIDVDTMTLEDLPARIAAFEISPSGPIWGPGMPRPTGVPGALEASLLHEAIGDVPLFERTVYGFEGTRRPVRVQVTAVEVDAGIDEHGEFIRVAFDLPRGAYATVLLREIMGEAETELPVEETIDDA